MNIQTASNEKLLKSSLLGNQVRKTVIWPSHASIIPIMQIEQSGRESLEAFP